MAKSAILTSFCWIFLPMYSGVRPTIRPAMKTPDDGVEQHAVEARADAAEDHFVGLHVEQRHEPADRRVAVVHAVDRAAAGVGRHGGEQRRGRDPEPRLLALHVAARLRGGRGAFHAQLRQDRIARLFRRIGDEHAHQEHDGHRPEERPSLPRVLHHVAERVGQAGAKDEDQEDVHEVREAVRALERVGRVGVEEAAAVRAELLDGHLRRDRTLRDRLRRAFDRLRDRVRVEVLDGALRARARAPRRSRSESGRTACARVRSTQKFPILSVS